jgi:hypothetical protein
VRFLSAAFELWWNGRMVINDWSVLEDESPGAGVNESQSIEKPTSRKNARNGAPSGLQLRSRPRATSDLSLQSTQEARRHQP